MNSALVWRLAVLASTFPVLTPAPHRRKECRGDSIRSHVVPLAPATAATPGRADPEPELPSFSSTQNTAACCGGCKYRPMMSAALFSKSGSLLAMYHN